MTEVKTKEEKKKVSVKEFGKMVVREGVNIIVGMFLGHLRAMQVNDFLFRE